MLRDAVDAHRWETAELRAALGDAGAEAARADDARGDAPPRAKRARRAAPPDCTHRATVARSFALRRQRVVKLALEELRERLRDAERAVAAAEAEGVCGGPSN